MSARLARIRARSLRRAELGGRDRMERGGAVRAACSACGVEISPDVPGGRCPECTGALDVAAPRDAIDELEGEELDDGQGDELERALEERLR